jgi:hypothetical protein
LFGLPERVEAVERGLALLAQAMQRDRYVENAGDADDVHHHELKVYSQNGEDGILLWLFSRIKPGSRALVEIGCGDGRECNGANLVLHWGWRGTFVDCDSERLDLARRFFDWRLGARAAAARCVHARATCENVDALAGAGTASGELDLLSIDVDGNDYWIWQALTTVRPRVVVIEYNAAFGCERAVTIPYDPTFDRRTRNPSGLYHGASLAALALLGDRKGYVLLGCDSEGVNAFFVRADQADGLPALTPAAAYRPCSLRHAPWSAEEQWSILEDLPLVEV